jgi:hypothetical protein
MNRRGVIEAAAGLAAASLVAGPCRSATEAAQRPAATGPEDSTSYSTAFGGVENPIDDGGRWTNGKAVGLDWQDVQSLSGRACASVLSGTGRSRYDDSIAVLKGNFPADQYAQGTVYRAPHYLPIASHEIELLLRFKITPRVARGYEVLWAHNGVLNIVRWNGPLGDYTPILHPDGVLIGPPVDGDVLRAEIVGTRIRVVRNGSLVASRPATTWRDGSPGVGFWPLASARPQDYGWKRFEAAHLA